VNTIALVAKKGKSEAADIAQQIRLRYPQLTFLPDAHLAEQLGERNTPSNEELGRRAELVVVLGGDGTLIYAARLLAGREVPILGINLGSLGFMTEVPKEDLFERLDDVLNGRATMDERIKLKCRLFRDNTRVLEDEVLNDVVINKGALARIADHETFVDGRLVTTYKSDGVIVASPTGSTAYALSAGGPIIHPRVDAIVIAPICPHALTQRPLLIPAERTISITLKSPAADVFLTIDGQAGLPLHNGDRIEVTKSANRVLLVRNPKMDYFSILRSKLHWGER
jgi:NAD+ kinase